MNRQTHFELCSQQLMHMKNEVLAIETETEQPDIYARVGSIIVDAEQSLYAILERPQKGHPLRKLLEEFHLKIEEMAHICADYQQGMGTRLFLDDILRPNRLALENGRLTVTTAMALHFQWADAALTIPPDCRISFNIHQCLNGILMIDGPGNLCITIPTNLFPQQGLLVRDRSLVNDDDDDISDYSDAD
jgi:hypothetical protein